MRKTCTFAPKLIPKIENEQLQIMSQTQTSMNYHATRLGLGRNGGKLLATESKRVFTKSRFNRLSTGFPKRAEQLPAATVQLGLPIKPVKTNVFLLRAHRRGHSTAAYFDNTQDFKDPELQHTQDSRDLHDALNSRDAYHHPHDHRATRDAREIYYTFDG